MAIFYHKKEFPEKLIYKKFNYISIFFIRKTIEKVIRLCTVLILFFLVVVLKIWGYIDP